MGTIAPQITSLAIVYSTVYSGTDQGKHQSSASLAFVWGIHRGPVNSPRKWPVTRQIFSFDDVIIDDTWILNLWFEWTPVSTPLDQHDINTLRPKQYGFHFADDIFKCIFLNQNVLISFKISLSWFLRVQLTIFQYWFRNGTDNGTDDKQLSEPMKVYVADAYLRHSASTNVQSVLRLNPLHMSMTFYTSDDKKSL